MAKKKARKFYKTVFELTVLSEAVLENMSLGELSYECMEGELSGSLTTKSVNGMTAKEAADALTAQGSDPEFFQLDSEGNDLSG